MRIAVLDANTDDSAMAERHPSLARLIAEGLHAQRPGWAIDTWAVHRGEWPADAEGPAIDAVVISGSVASVNDDAPWIRSLEALVRARHAARLPVAGLCFGHQLIGKALGGRVGPSPGGWRVGLAPTHWQSQPHWMAPPRAVMHLHAVHQEQVLQPPPGVAVIGGDAFAPVGAMAAGQHLLSTQYHPELSAAFMRDLLDLVDDAWSSEHRQRAQAEVALGIAERDAALFFRWVVQWLEAARP